MPRCLCQEPCSVCGLDRFVERFVRSAELVAESPAMQAALRLLHDFADTDAPVVIRGETGTGKELAARALHAASSRRSAPFIAVNVAALPAELLESELFGHVRGAFTGAATDTHGLLQAADGGTLLLDEIGDMPLPLQAKLLRVLEDGEIRRVGETRPFSVDVRLVCATHRDLVRAVEEGRFREDLFYRLDVLSLVLPPLRDRPEDILPLAAQFLAKEPRPAKLGEAARQALVGYAWPGKVRQFANAMRRGAALARGGEVTPAHLPAEVQRPAPRGSPGDLGTLAQVEHDHVLRVLERCGGSQSEAARVLGIGRNTLWRKLKGYGTGGRGVMTQSEPRG